MPTIFATVSTLVPPAIAITMSGSTSYTQFKQSLGNYVYYVDKVYLYSNNAQQIQGAFFYLKYDSNGNTDSQSVISAISPYQFENAIFLFVSEKGLVLDGRDYVKFNMQPNTTLSIKLYVKIVSVGDDLDDMGINAFYELDKTEDTKFFDDYNEYL